MMHVQLAFATVRIPSRLGVKMEERQLRERGRRSILTSGITVIPWITMRCQPVLILQRFHLMSLHRKRSERRKNTISQIQINIVKGFM